MTIYGRNITEADMEAIAVYLDDEIREEVHNELAPCTPEEFLAAYLEKDPDFITVLETEFGFEQ